MKPQARSSPCAVLPWATTYRYLVYGAHPDELLPGERVNLFFNPDEKQKRGYLVHFQDELCQMKGHGHAWEVQTVTKDGREFTARVLAGAKPLDGKSQSFRLDADGRHWRGGKCAEAHAAAGRAAVLNLGLPRRPEAGASHDGRRQPGGPQEGGAGSGRRPARAGGTRGPCGKDRERPGGPAGVPHLLGQAGQWKEGQTVEIRGTTTGFRPDGEPIAAKLLTRKNLGTYGSGATEVSVRLSRRADLARVKACSAARWFGWWQNESAIHQDCPEMTGSMTSQ